MKLCILYMQITKRIKNKDEIICKYIVSIHLLMQHEKILCSCRIASLISLM